MEIIANTAKWGAGIFNAVNFALISGNSYIGFIRLLLA